MAPQEGDIVRITQPRKDHSYRFFARVTWAREVEGGTYFGYEPVDPPRGQWGEPAHFCAWGCKVARREPLPYGPTVEVWPRAGYRAA